MATSRRTHYEWLVEEIDAHGDILDIHHADTFADVWAWSQRYPPSGDVVRHDIGLTRRIYEYFDGECGGMIDLEWAYLEDGVLPERFADSGGCETVAVPKRFRQDVQNVLDKCHSL
mgnify:CR=1 FL=1